MLPLPIPPIYTLSDSDSSSEKDSADSDDFLLGISSPLFKKPKNESKKSQSPTKPKKPRKTDEEKQRISEEKRRLKEEKQQKAEEDKRKKKEAKQKALEEKNKEKAEKKKKNDLLKQLKPSECFKYITAFIDSTLLNCQFGSELLAALRNSDLKYLVRDQTIPSTISWQRDMEEQDIIVPEHIVIIWTWEELIHLISCVSLNDTVNKLLQQNPRHKLTIVIFGIEEYFRQRKTLKNRELRANVSGEPSTQTKKKNYPAELSTDLSREDIEMALATLQLTLNVQYNFLESNEEVGLFAAQFTKAVANLPHKLKKREVQDSTDWFAQADSKECVRVDNDGNGLSRLWQQQICQFSNVGHDVAQALASEYPSPSALMEAYGRCSTQKEGELLLQNIQIRRTHGPCSTVRRLGPELSKKLYKFFTTTDGNLLLSNEK